MKAKSTTGGVLLGVGVVAATFALAVPTRADVFEDKFFAIAKQVHPDPDTVELARYYVDESEHAQAVYEKAAGQDYVFIGILIVAKNVRNQTIPKTSLTFTYDTCMTPINAFDAVFAKSGEFINKYGQEEHVKAYAQQENAEAKKEAGEKLAEYVPYWKEIPHICHFTFFTNLQREKDMRETIVGKSRVLKGSYDDFKSGDIPSGMAKLAAAGVSEGAACNFIDQMVYGGAVSNTPILGKLALGACKGFVGNVIRGVEGVAAAGVDEVSNLGDKVAGQTKHIPPDQYYAQNWAPHIDEGVTRARAGTFGAFLSDLWHPCADYFDKHTMSRKNAQKTCDSFRDTQFVPAVLARQVEQDKMAEIEKDLGVWGHEYRAKWTAECWDNACEDEIKRLRDEAVTQGRSLEKTNAMDGWPFVLKALASYPGSATTEIERSKKRFAQKNKEITDKAAPAWASALIQLYREQCADDPCIKEVKQIGQTMVIGEKLLQMALTEESSGAIQGKINREYGARFNKAIDDSRLRSASTNKQITDEAAPAWAQLYIGVWTPQCLDETCRKEVKTLAGQMVIATKLTQMAKKDESSSNVQKEVGQEYRPKFQHAVDESKRRQVAADPSAKADDRLAALGCKSFLARAGEWMCGDDAAFDVCVGYVKKASGTSICMHSGDPKDKRRYATEERLGHDMKVHSCERAPGSALVFNCKSDEGEDLCEDYRAGGVKIACNGPHARHDSTVGAGTHSDDSRSIPAGSGERNPGTVKPAKALDMKDDLAEKGCKSFLGRADEFLCTTERGYDACLGYKKKEKVKECRQSRR